MFKLAGRAKENLPGGNLKYLFVYSKIRIFKCSYHIYIYILFDIILYIYIYIILCYFKYIYIYYSFIYIYIVYFFNIPD